MSLHRYLVRLETVLYSRRDIDVERFQVDVLTIGAKFRCEIRFYDGSHLSVVEELESVAKEAKLEEKKRKDYVETTETDLSSLFSELEKVSQETKKLNEEDSNCFF